MSICEYFAVLSISLLINGQNIMSKTDFWQNGLLQSQNDQERNISTQGSSQNVWTYLSSEKRRTLANDEVISATTISHNGYSTDTDVSDTRSKILSTTTKKLLLKLADNTGQKLKSTLLPHTSMRPRAHKHWDHKAKRYIYHNRGYRRRYRPGYYRRCGLLGCRWYPLRYHHHHNYGVPVPRAQVPVPVDTSITRGPVGMSVGYIILAFGSSAVFLCLVIGCTCYLCQGGNQGYRRTYYW